MITNFYVGNLSLETTPDDLNSLFGQVSRVISIEILNRSGTNPRDGFGFVEVDAVSVEDVIYKLSITEVDGRRLKVRRAFPQVPAVAQSSTIRLH